MAYKMLPCGLAVLVAGNGYMNRSFMAVNLIGEKGKDGKKVHG